MFQKRIFHKYISLVLLFSTLVLSLCGLTSCASIQTVDSNDTKTSQEAFLSFLEEEFRSSFDDDLISLHYTLKNPTIYQIDKPDKAIPDINMDSFTLQKEDLQQSLHKLRQISKKHLTAQQKRIYETLERYLKQQIDLCDYPQFQNLLSYGSGLSSNLPLTLAEYAFYEEEDIKEYLSILTQIPEILSEAFLWEQDRMASGYGMASFEIDHAIEQMDSFCQSTLLIDSFETRLSSLDGILENQKTTYLANNKSLVNNTVLPAFLKLKEDLTSLKTSASEGKGLCLYKQGTDYYELLIASMTLSDWPLSTMVHTLEERLNVITKEISQIVMDDPDAYSIFCSIWKEDILSTQTPKEMLLQLETKIAEDFPPLSNVVYQVNPIPDALKNDSTAAYYLIPPYDSPEENRIYYGDFSEDQPSLFMILAHEGYPGHLYHQNYLLEQGLTPLFSVMDFTGYKEGWAFYAGILGADYYDYGKYDEEHHDSLTKLYRYDLEYSYCISSLVDLYVNGIGYDKEDVFAFLAPLGMDEETSNSLFQSAIEEPGTYLQYYIGYLELLSLRQDMEQKEGIQFSLKEFHERLLSFGPCYYADLAKYMSPKY